MIFHVGFYSPFVLVMVGEYVIVVIVTWNPLITKINRTPLLTQQGIWCESKINLFFVTVIFRICLVLVPPDLDTAQNILKGYRLNFY